MMAENLATFPFLYMYEAERFLRSRDCLEEIRNRLLLFLFLWGLPKDIMIQILSLTLLTPFYQEEERKLVAAKNSALLLRQSRAKISHAEHVFSFLLY